MSSPLTGGPAMRRALATVFAIAVIAAALGIGVRATFGGHVSVDEPQYLLTALSLAEDGDLDISDELAERRYGVFSDIELPPQTAVLPGGRQISPHDPLLPIVLAAPMGLGGWVAAKATLSLLAGALAALTLWIAVRRFAVPVRLATIGAGLAAASAPLAVYGQQVYPELPAALCVLVAFAALTGEPRRRNLVTAAVAITALPWLSVKYAPVAAVLALMVAVRWWRAGRRAEVAALAVAMALGGAAFLGIHQLVWGGWTAYASGDHFQRAGEFGVVGFTPNYPGRALRLVGLLVDRGFGLAAWQPAWLLVVPAAAALARRRPAGGLTAALPLAVGWLVATFVALTMHGFWWPGRQLVVVLPLALLLVLWWLAGAGRALRIGALGLAATGAVTYVCLLIDGYGREITWVSGFERVDSPLYQLARWVLPDYRGEFWALHLAWIAAIAALAVLGWRSARPAAPPPGLPEIPVRSGLAPVTPATVAPPHPTQKGPSP